MSSPASLLVEEALSLNAKTPASFSGSDVAHAVVEAFRWLDLGTLELGWFHAEAYQNYEVRHATVVFCEGCNLLEACLMLCTACVCAVVSCELACCVHPFIWPP